MLLGMGAVNIDTVGDLMRYQALLRATCRTCDHTRLLGSCSSGSTPSGGRSPPPSGSRARSAGPPPRPDVPAGGPGAPSRRRPAGRHEPVGEFLKRPLPPFLPSHVPGFPGSGMTLP